MKEHTLDIIIDFGIALALLLMGTFILTYGA